MFLFANYGAYVHLGFPRARGDVPWGYSAELPNGQFSPHTRGCSVYSVTVGIAFCVFPAYAGMFPPGASRCSPRPCFPRIRGDVPLEEPMAGLGARFSPHTRRCSACIIILTSGLYVFPAYAGMFRRVRRTEDRRGCFPRIRGDVPPRSSHRGQAWMFSPNTRGCSVLDFVQAVNSNVFPAYAGMFPTQEEIPHLHQIQPGTWCRNYDVGKYQNQVPLLQYHPN